MVLFFYSELNIQEKIRGRQIKDWKDKQIKRKNKANVHVLNWTKE